MAVQLIQYHLLKAFLSFIELFLHSCQKSVGHIYVSLSIYFVSFIYLFCFIDLSVNFSTNITQSLLLLFYSKT